VSEFVASINCELPSVFALKFKGQRSTVKVKYAHFYLAYRTN